MTRFLAEWAAITASVVVAYLYYVRPYLKRIQKFSVLWEQEGKFFTALKMRFAGIKTYLAVGVGQAVCFVLVVYDTLLPYAIGIDWSPLTSKVPSWLWPVLCLFWLYLIAKCRKWTDDRRELGEKR